MTHIYDLDGTLLKFHTNEWLPGALDRLRKHVADGDGVIFITARNDHMDKDTEWSPLKTLEGPLADLDALGLKYNCIFDVTSPRRLYCDYNPEAVARKTDEPWVQGD